MYEECYMHGQWFLDREGYLYINPESYAAAEILGPAGAIMDALNEACCANDGGDVPDDVIAELDLLEIGPIDRRFTPESGYFIAE